MWLFIKEYWRKEFLLHWQKPQKMLGILMLAMLIFTIFHFALDAKEKSDFGVAVYWVQFLIIGTLALQKILISDETSSMDRLIRLSDRSTFLIFTAKLSANLIFWLVVQVLLLSATGLFYDSRFFEKFLPLLAIVVVCSIGFLSLGLTVSLSVRDNPFLEIILPLLVMPMALPVFLGGIQTFSLIIYETSSLIDIISWLKLIFLFDLLFVIGGAILVYYID